MELLDLFSGFDLDHVKDSDLKTIAKGLAVTVVRSPLEHKHPADISQAYAAVSDTMNSYLHSIINGNLFTKAKMISTVTVNIARAGDLAVEKADIDVMPMLKIVENMHIHHLSEPEYKQIADEFARIIVMTGSFPDTFDNALSKKKVLISDAASKIYTALQMALKEKDFLIEQASGSTH